MLGPYFIISGGLGNQLFQVAFALAVKKQFNLEGPPKLIVSDFFLAERDFGLDAFCVDLKVIKLSYFSGKILNYIIKIVQKFKIIQFPNFLYSESKRGYSIGSLSHLFVLYMGYFQSDKYLEGCKDIIKDSFRLKSNSSNYKDMVNIIEMSPCSIAIHVRRGDYLVGDNIEKYGVGCSVKYFEQGVKIIMDKCKKNKNNIFIFSDDIDWCRKNLNFVNGCYVSEMGLSVAEELILMSKCDHHVISNSTFSWWGAYLALDSVDHTVIAPKRWFGGALANDAEDMVPSRWVRY